MAPSVLDDLGSELTAVVAPVSICIAITVWLVAVLNPDGQSNSRAMSIATAAYAEDDTDSDWTKFRGSLLNAFIFVAFIGIATFGLVAAVKRGYTRWIFLYMCFSVFSVFFTLNGLICVELLQAFSLPFDWVSLTLLLYNTAVLGAATLFHFPAPLLLKQANLIAVGVGTAFTFTFVPEWTSWTLLVAMALYDIAAVLAPWGPLKELVDLASESGDPIPALVYSARPAGGAAEAAGARSAEAGPLLARPARPAPVPELAVQAGRETAPEDASPGPAVESERLLRPRSSTSGQPDGPLPFPISLWTRTDHPGLLRVTATGPESQQRSAPSLHPAASERGSEDGVWLPDGIRLGMGDFIFYSVLVARASMHSALAAGASFLAVVAGLACTLLWLSVAHSALPALPISIALGTLAYFATRTVLEPTLLPLTLHGLYF
uniref:Presenilin n=2 Tax=Auxenochlorella protothecoides TaxID=3075 RepID=A0A1D2A137_AUXPR